MSDSSHLPHAFEFVCAVEGVYRSLMVKACAADADDRANEPSLGGQLLYAGELDEQGRLLAVAGNIAGAATLCATADVQAQKQAVRDGVVDFLVTSLDEALRILKNQVRKRETVAVCVGSDPGAMEREMADRGVRPDMLRGDLREGVYGADRPVLVTWQVEAAPGRWMPKLDSLALECIGADDAPARRWIRLAPRYLGRAGQQTHLLHSSRAFADRFSELVRERVDSGEIAATVRFSTGDGDRNIERRFCPKASS